MGAAMNFAETIVETADWSNAEVLRGTGANLAGDLLKFLGCEDAERMADLWWGLEGVVFSQDTIYGAAEPVTDVLMAALADSRPDFVKAWILEALRFILGGGSVADPELQSRCRDRARSGAWLLAAVSSELLDPDRQAVVELLEVINPSIASVVRMGLDGGKPQVES